MSAEDAVAKQLKEEKLLESTGETPDGALKLLPIRIPTEWRIVQVHL